ncbi:M1 family metallopeptidase [Sphingomonas prati]|uniref:Aminopeptidase n=1 Tax=Sphingomonas prati TaxID=1843237 RepID=A0A7W9F1K1_9SPHN|nr:M1 family metallopeptidase [Sphingomonas prati]MBB5727849.1 aminopeptidase N [Sphingomonas prati]GGE81294.1 aminopeptidase [Sphingomonas prati]
MKSYARLSALLLASVTLVGAAPAPLPAVGVQQPGRLPPGVTPLHYEISVEPDAQKLNFTGSETVTIAVTRPTTRIVLNAAELAVGYAKLDDSTTPSKLTLDAAAQTLTLDFAKPVAAGTHRLAMSFSGKINESAAGMFAVDYQDGNTPKRMVVTQFEPADARRFAPMWDEPGAKATFSLTAVTPKGQSSFSNMPIASQAKRADGKTVVTFAKSPKMSSYLLFLGQGEIERKARMVGNTEIGVITRKGALAQADYALDAAARILPYYNDYFGVPYPLPKMDMIAAPGSSQFFSAMENWGAILYFDRAVLLDPKLSTETQRQDIFNVVAHEMAHQWFGDLVTMGWWDDLWLNEGFASWMAAKVTGDLNPDWNVPAQDVAGARQAAFGVDARASTHPIVQKIGTVDEVSQAFDTITYQKGQAVIRMLEGAVGPDPFRNGVRAYMAKHQYGNTVTDDLWQSISASAGRPVKPFMDSFTLQGGVPLITGTEPVCSGGKTRIGLSQGRFGLDAASKTAQRWIVPVEMTTGGASTTTTVSGPARQSATAAGCGPLVINPRQQGYYRTLTAPKHFETLSRGFGQLALTDQLGLMGDSVALANGGYAPLSRYLTLLDRIPQNASPIVWDLAATQLGSLDGLLDGDPVQAAFRTRARGLLAPQFRRVGFVARTGETPSDSILRETLIQVLGGMGDPEVVAGARKLVAGGLDDIPGAVREPVTTVYLSNATPAQWEAMRKLAASSKDAGVRRSLYSRLGNVADPALAQRALDLALTNEATVPDRANLIRGAAYAHPGMTFDWAAAHKDQVNALVEASSRPRYIVGLAGQASDPAVATRVEAYAQANLPPASRQGAVTSVSQIRYRAGLKAAQRAPLAAWSQSAPAR